MPFIRQTRDRRGYEQTCVMHVYRPAGGAQRTRVLYLFRSPAHLRIGRSALDDEAREGLEHTHPDLSFDWMALLKETERVERWERPRTGKSGESRESRPRRERSDDRGHGGAPRQATPSTHPARPADTSPLSLVAGAGEANRLRQRYTELVNRITRRVPNPEDRDQLLERLRRLNPDEWADEATARQALPSLEGEWDRLGAAIPSRRRGRRGGRHRHEGGTQAQAGTEASGIIKDDGERNDEQRIGEAVEPDRGDDAVRDVGGAGAGAEDPSAGAQDAPADGQAAGPAPDLRRPDRLHLD